MCEEKNKQDKRVTEFVARRIAVLEHMSDQGRQKAVLAELRRGVGRGPGELPQLWGMIFRDLSEDMMGKFRTPSWEEWAIYTALTMYAYHQQGRDPARESMNQTGQGVGRALAGLVKEDNDLSKVQGRFNRFAMTDDMAELAVHLRGIISLLRREGICLDYPGLARDLYWYQNDNRISGVRLQWGRDFYRAINEQLGSQEDS